MLEINNVSFRYDREPVLNGIDLTVNPGEIVSLLGESGSGKSTLLRLIAGLETFYTGDICADGKLLKDVPVHKRGFGLMFQDFALFPHMNVAQNVAFGLRMQGIHKKEQDKIVDEMLALAGLDGYQERSVDSLSGGQKQRVALARSLAPRPALLMLDEPLGSLDAGLRERLVLEVRQIIKKIGLTAIYVTHDQHEAYAIADRIAIMKDGSIEQYARPEKLYHHPESVFVAQFLGLSNIVPSNFLQQYLDVPNDTSYYLLHPESLTLDEKGQVEATVTGYIFQGDRYRLTVKTGDTELTLYHPSSATMPAEGDIVRISIHPLSILAINS